MTEKLKDIPIWTQHNKREAVYNKRLMDYIEDQKPKKIREYKENGLLIKVYEGR